MRQLVLLLFFFSFMPFAFASQQEPFALVVKVKGDVKVSGREVVKGEQVREGVTVVAKGKGSFIQLRFLDGPQVLLRNGTVILKRPGKKKGTMLELIKGTLFSDVEKKGKKHFFIKTPTASLGVRGTKFYTEVTEDDTYLCVCEGVVALTNKKGTIEVERKEDIHAGQNTELKKTPANKMMWKMALEGFGLMGVKVK